MTLRPCEHGVPFTRLPDGSTPQCDECDLIWEESCIRMAQESLAAHTQRRNALLIRLRLKAASPESHGVSQDESKADLILGMGGEEGASVAESGGSALPKSERPGDLDRGAGYQARVHDWMLACFGQGIASDPVERSFRFLEEALELVQANGCTALEAQRLVEYVYGRPTGEVHQEVGGVAVCLAALCTAAVIDLEDAAETELARVWTKVEKIRAKHASKPPGVRSSLPGLALPAKSGPGDRASMREGNLPPDTPNPPTEELTPGEPCDKHNKPEGGR